MELTNIQRLAIADAFIKACKDEQKRMREDVDSESIQLFLETGADRRSVSLNGEKVGTISVVTTKVCSLRFRTHENSQSGSVSPMVEWTLSTGLSRLSLV